MKWAGFAALVLFFSSLATASDRVALLIGNEGYQALPALANPHADVERMATALRSVGFTVQVERELDQAATRAALGAFAKQAQGAQLALVHYSGHGVQMGARNYLVPLDMPRANAPERLVALDEVLLATAGAAARVIVLDACRDNPLPQMAEPIGTAEPSVRDGAVLTRGLMPVKLTTGGSDPPTVLAFATEPGAVAIDGVAGSASPFSAALSRHLVTPGLDVRAVFDKVVADVLERTEGKQRPWVNASLTGDVYLVAPTSGDLEIVVRRPEGASIWVAGELRGSDEVVLRALPAGSYPVRVEAEGYRFWEGEGIVRAGQVETLQVSLLRQRASSGNVLQQMNAGRDRCCDDAGRPMCLMPAGISGQPLGSGCRCPGQAQQVGVTCRAP